MNDIKLESCPVCGSDPVFTENFSEEIKLAARTQPAPDQIDDVPMHTCIMQLDKLGDL